MLANKNNSLCLAALVMMACQHKAPEKPNVIFILADDLGYGDLGCYGQSLIKTPCLDQMASEGLRFTRFYAGSAVSAPSRCALMTGKHMGHAYIRNNAKNVFLRKEDTTLSQVLQQAGYVTGMFGKWGLGDSGTTGDPVLKGWNAFTGYTDQVKAHFYYQKTIDKIVQGKTCSVPVDSTKYTYEIEIEDAFRFIRENHRNPFFVYLATRIPHAELIVPAGDLKQYLDKDGHSIFQEVPYPGGEFKPFDKPYAAYAAMITKLDKDIGRLLLLLKELGIEKKTLVIFTSDNGPAGGYDGQMKKYFSSSGPLRGGKGNLYEGGIRVPFIAWWPGTVPAGKTTDVPAAFWDIPATLCELAGIRTTTFPDGISFVPLLQGREQNIQHPFLYFEHAVPWELSFMQTICEGDWKLIKTKRNILPAVYELFNLREDVSESHNLASLYPDRVKELEEKMKREHQAPVLKVFDYSFLPDAVSIPRTVWRDEKGEKGSLTGYYFDGKNFDRLVYKKNDTAFHFIWGNGSPDRLPADGFSVRWKGSICPEETGTYNFYTAADDGARLWINGQLVIDDWNAHGVEVHQGSFLLEKGKSYPVCIEYLESSGGAEFGIGWKKKNIDLK